MFGIAQGARPRSDNLCLLGVRVADLGTRRYWLAPIALASFALIWLVFTSANPQRLIVEYNTSDSSTAELDLGYLAGLSDDAVPTLISKSAYFTPDQVSYLQDELCPRLEQDKTGMQRNLSELRALQELESWCPSPNKHHG